MRCYRCQTENRPGMPFCARCGATMSQSDPEPDLGPPPLPRAKETLGLLPRRPVIPAPRSAEPLSLTPPPLIDTSEISVDVDFESARERRVYPAGPVRRAVAWLIDILTLAIPGYGLWIAAEQLTGLSQISSREQGLDWLVEMFFAHRKSVVITAAIIVVVAFAYGMLCHARFGATLGKKLLGIRVVTANGEPPSMSRSAWRTSAALVSFGMLFLGYWLALFTRSGRAFHDFASGTFVVQHR